ncbi:MAG TPA: hypothetical protein VMB66_04150 [Candidatus Acidoferrales bacterium]|nr:hypothetical protein [Candidatus Acidoferrales bacterium]
MNEESSTKYKYALLFVLALMVAAFRAEAQTNAYHVMKRIPIAGDTGWDYITADSEARRLYVPHGTEVVVLDLDSGVIVGKITDLKGVHGVAVARAFGHGFISASDPGSVIMFDLKTLAVLGTQRVGDDPNGIIYDPKTKMVFSADRGSQRLTALDARTGKIAGVIGNLGGRTEHLAADGSGHVFLNMQDVGKLHELDVRSYRILKTWDLTPTCVQPSSMDIDTVHHRIFIGCRGGTGAPSLFVVVDAASGKIVASQPIGPGVDAVEFDSTSRFIYVAAGGKGLLFIFREDTPDKYTLVQNVETLPGARTLALDQKTGRLYLPVADMGAPPPPTAENPRPRQRMVPGSFSVLVVGE